MVYSKINVGLYKQSDNNMKKNAGRKTPQRVIKYLGGDVVEYNGQKLTVDFYYWNEFSYIYTFFNSDLEISQRLIHKI